MNNKKIMIAFGTRPEAIKMCPLVKELESRTGAEICVCLTGQHKELLHSVTDAFGIRADITLDIMKAGQSVAAMVSRLMCEGERVLCEYNPDILLVHGDTATAFAMSTAAFFSGISVAHIEAGLRSGDMHQPFPEEFNRRAISLASELHFAPTEQAASNLLEEGIPLSRIYVTGNTVIDALGYTLRERYTHPLLEHCEGKRIIFFTAHRRENHGKRLVAMLSAARRICESFSDVRIIFPVHPSREVSETAEKILGKCEGALLTRPLGVADCHNIMARSYLILTDSGGLQEEAAAMHKPVLVMRNTTERPEGILAGISRLAGTDEEQIFATAAGLLKNGREYSRMANGKNPYGDGEASRRIADALLQ